MTTEEPKKEEENYITIETVDFKSKSSVMNSPRSLEACKMLGVEPGELYYIPIEAFKEQHPDMKRLPNDLQQYRYDQFEKFRNDTINQVKEARNNIIEAEKEKEQSKNQSGDTKNSSCEKSDRDERMDKLIEQEKKAIEKIKNRQKAEIEAIIETQIKTEMMHKQNEEKERRQREREEQQKKELEKKQKEQEEIRRQREKKRKEELQRQ